jgi:hypothetical protein
MGIDGDGAQLKETPLSAAPGTLSAGSTGLRVAERKRDQDRAVANCRPERFREFARLIQARRGRHARAAVAARRTQVGAQVVENMGRNLAGERTLAQP